VDVDAEITCNVDPSTDRTELVIGELHRRDGRVRMQRSSRRFGQPAATLAGMTAALGDACVVIDCDPQDPPS
jgi:polyisoprenyl-phosphate glycosyltransferase